MNKYSEEELIEELQRVSEEHCDGEVPKTKQMKKYSKYSLSPYYNNFETFGKIKEKVFDDYTLYQDRSEESKKYSRKKLLTEMQRVSEEHCNGKSPRGKDMKKFGEPSVTAYKNEFGKWSNALKKAGFAVDQFKYSEKKLIDEILRISEKYCDCEAPKREDMDNHSEYSHGVYRNRFGSWNNSLQKAGFEPNSKRYISDVDLIEELQRLDDGNEKLTQDLMVEKGKYGCTVYRNRFGSWNEALKEAAIEPNRYYNIKDHELIKDIIRVSNYLNKSPTRSEYQQHGKYSTTTISRRFKGWSQALKKCELEPNLIKNIPDHKLLEEIHKVSEEYCNGKRPKQKDMKTHGKYSDSVYQRFGGWKEAVKKAGFEREAEQYFMYTKEEILEEINRIFKEMGRKPSRSEFGEYSDISVGVFCTRFDSWNEALEEAGFDRNGVGYNAVNGKDHPHWKGGISFNNYGKNWEESKKKCLQRDEYSCRICNCLIDHEWFNNPDVHHITPARYWNIEEEYESMNHLRNLICLCRSCHHELEGKFKARNHEEFEKLARGYLDIEFKEERGIKKSLFDY